MRSSVLSAKLDGRGEIEHSSRMKIGGDRHSIPRRVDGFVDEWRGSLEARGEELGLCRYEQRLGVGAFELEAIGGFFKRVFHVEHVLLRVVVHIADWADVVVELGDAQLFRR